MPSLVGSEMCIRDSHKSGNLLPPTLASLNPRSFGSGIRLTIPLKRFSAPSYSISLRKVVKLLQGHPQRYHLSGRDGTQRYHLSVLFTEQSSSSVAAITPGSAVPRRKLTSATLSGLPKAMMPHRRGASTRLWKLSTLLQRVEFCCGLPCLALAVAHCRT